MNVMVNPPEDPGDVVEAIASSPDEDEIVRHKHWSFASKISHFFINGDANTPHLRFIFLADVQRSRIISAEVRVILIQKTHQYFSRI